MEVTFFGTSAGLPTKERNTQSIAFKSRTIFKFDMVI